MLKLNNLVGFGVGGAAGLEYIGLDYADDVLSGSTTITSNIHADTQEGDLLIAFFAVLNSSSWTTQTGWTQANTSAMDDLQVFYKVATASDITAGSFTFSDAAATRKTLIIMSYRNASFDTANTSTSHNGSSPATSNSITSTKNGSTLLFGAYAEDPSESFSTPTGMTLIGHYGNSNQTSISLFKQEGIAAGATGNKSTTFVGGGEIGAIMLIVQDA